MTAGTEQILRSDTFLQEPHLLDEPDGFSHQYLKQVRAVELTDFPVDAVGVRRAWLTYDRTLFGYRVRAWWQEENGIYLVRMLGYFGINQSVEATSWTASEALVILSMDFGLDPEAVILTAAENMPYLDEDDSLEHLRGYLDGESLLSLAEKHLLARQFGLSLQEIYPDGDFD